MGLPSPIIDRISRSWHRQRSGSYRRRAYRVSQRHGGELSWPESAVAHVPVRVDGAGRVALGKKVNLGYRPAPRLGDGEILLQARGGASEIQLGAGTLTSNNVVICAMRSVRIGEGCQIGDQVAVYDCDFHEIDPSTRLDSPGEIAPVSIGNNVWLGSRVMVLKGCAIGDNSVVAAGAIVTKSLPANVLAAGIPAKVLRPIGD